MSRDLWRLLGQREIIEELIGWHIAMAKKLRKSKPLVAGWHLASIAQLESLDKAVVAEMAVLEVKEEDVK